MTTLSDYLKSVAEMAECANDSSRSHAFRCAKEVPKLLRIIAHQQETIDQHSKSLFINIPLGFRQWVDKRQRELEAIANE